VEENKFYIHSSEVISFINDCTMRGEAIIGFEGFKKIDKKFVPDLGLIGDFSSLVNKYNDWVIFLKECNKTAKKILGNLEEKNNLFYDFALMSEIEWSKRNR